ncbi:unnamed protein product, partial [Ectocarpus sp. 12 AP-2014]
PCSCVLAWACQLRAGLPVDAGCEDSNDLDLGNDLGTRSDGLDEGWLSAPTSLLRIKENEGCGLMDVDGGQEEA